MAKAKGRRRIVGTAEDTVTPSPLAHESGLGRWSRRKAMARAEPAVPLRPDAPPAVTAEEVSAIEKTDADMPAIDSLDGDSDYSAFLSPKVSEKLRRMALRKLFHLPQYNVQDDLDFCSGDFRNFTPLGNIITADMRYHMERELKALNERLAAESDDKRVTEKTVEATTSDTRVSESTTPAELPEETGGEPTPDIPASKTSNTQKG